MFLSASLGRCYGTVTISLVPFLLLRSYGSGSDFCQVTVLVPVPYQYHKKHSFQKMFGIILPFYILHIRNIENCG
jgi:hypothetical protein